MSPLHPAELLMVRRLATLAATAGNYSTSGNAGLQAVAELVHAHFAPRSSAILEFTLIQRLAAVARTINRYDATEVAEAAALSSLALAHFGAEPDAPTVTPTLALVAEDAA